MSLLTIVQQASSELGLTIPQTIFGNYDTQVQQMLNLSKQGGIQLARRTEKRGWQVLVEEHVWQLVGQTDITGTVTENSTTITDLSTVVGITPGQAISGDGILNASYVVSVGVDSLVMTQPGTSTGVVTDITIGTDQYDMPADFLYFIPSTEWDRSYRWQMMGPMNASEWQILKSGITPTGPRMRFRIKNNKIFIDPVPGLNLHNLVFEYISSYWCKNADDEGQATWMADTDVSKFDETLHILDLKWRFLRAKGVDYSSEKAECEEMILKLIGLDGTSRALPTNAQANRHRFLTSANVPDTGYGH